MPLSLTDVLITPIECPRCCHSSVPIEIGPGTDVCLPLFDPLKARSDERLACDRAVRNPSNGFDSGQGMQKTAHGGPLLWLEK